MPEITVYGLYCGNTECNVRNMTVFAKNFGDRPDPKQWKCPGCGCPTKTHYRESLHDHEANELESAVGRVNAALFQREHGDGVPVSIMSLKNLPTEWHSVSNVVQEMA